jgi:3D (Asp-Asp-Asp) domain-containing protein
MFARNANTSFIWTVNYSMNQIFALIVEIKRYRRRNRMIKLNWSWSELFSNLANILVISLLIASIYQGVQMYKHFESLKKDIDAEIKQYRLELEETRRFRESIEAFLCKLHIIESKVTYYSPFDNQSGIEGGPITATGSRPYPGTFAVDPSKVPLGSNMMLVYANGIIEVGKALDTGGAIKGNRVDAFRWTYRETVQWGEKYATAIWVN